MKNEHISKKQSSRHIKQCICRLKTPITLLNLSTNQPNHQPINQSFNQSVSGKQKCLYVPHLRHENQPTTVTKINPLQYTVQEVKVCKHITIHKSVG